MRSAVIISSLLLAGAPVSAAVSEAPPALQNAQEYSGLLPVKVNRKEGRIFLSLPPAAADGLSAKFLYISSLKTGLGSAPIGLDRMSSTRSKIIAFRRLGKKVAAEIENPRFRATNAPGPEQAAARESFAYSTIWMGDVASETPDGRIWVDISSLLTRGTFGISDALKNGGEKGFTLDKELSAADPNMVKVFPENIELEARLTFVSAEPGPEIRNIAPHDGNVSLVVRHSLIKLPEPGYEPRRFDPRGGSFGTQILDFTAPLGQPIVYEFANRFRLEKIDPDAPRSRVKKPIIFYIDRSAPEPIRTALLEGASWWKKAFEDAGFIDAFQVEILPEDADPLDIRYNVVNWVNRATRGWSYGF